MAKRKNTKKDNSDNNSLFFLVIIAIILIVTSILLFQKRETIFPKVMERISEIKNVEEKDADKNEKPATEDLDKTNNIPIKIVNTPEVKKPEPEKKDDPIKKQETPNKPVTQPPAPIEKPTSLRTTQKLIYFIKYEADSSQLKIVGVQRTIKYESSPLTQTLNTLFYGPTAYELQKDLITLIPTKSKIKSVSIKNGIAYIDLNQDFSINTNGTEGTKAQLMQVVWTAMEFPTVEAVQFLIEGQIVQFLTEGIKINQPINKNYFK